MYSVVGENGGWAPHGSLHHAFQQLVEHAQRAFAFDDGWTDSTHSRVSVGSGSFWNAVMAPCKRIMHLAAGRAS
jgi:hypothetical protein